MKNLKAKSARLEAIAASQNCAIFNLSKKAKSNLVFRRSSLEKIAEEDHPRNVNTNLLERVLQKEKQLDYFIEDGKYWKYLDRLDQEKIDYLDEIWNRVIERD